MKYSAFIYFFTERYFVATIMITNKKTLLTKNDLICFNNIKKVTNCNCVIISRLITEQFYSSRKIA